MLAVAWLNAHLIIIVLVVAGGLGYLGMRRRRGRHPQDHNDKTSSR